MQAISLYSNYSPSFILFNLGVWKEGEKLHKFKYFKNEK